jgi:NAD(P) transhydrogenase subunit beta
MSHGLVQLAYIIATGLFVFALHWMNAPATARNGVYAGVAGMALAIAATWAEPEVIHHGWIVLALVAGVAVGVPLSRVPLTAVPQRTALSHAFGGLAAGLVGTAKYYLWLGEGPENLTAFRMIAIIVEIILGFLTFTGSLLAAGKLQEVKWIPQRPVTYPLQNVTNLGLFGVAAVAGVALVLHPTAAWAPAVFPVIIGMSLLFGVLLIIPIGGADMPTVIAILNAYAGLSAVAMGFVLDNKLLITAGALDGSSGLILAVIMCKAMNRSFANVLFGAFGQVQQTKALEEGKEYKAESIEGAAQVLEQANLVVIVPGYGMAVAQAQHKVRELYDQLKKRGITVKFAIHPVAGRMPGHMNVLLAEADIPYTDLVEMDEINSDMPQVDVALVVRHGPRRPARSTGCRSSTPIGRAPCSPSSAARTRGSPGSTTSCTFRTRPGCCSAMPKTSSGSWSSSSPGAAGCTEGRPLSPLPVSLAGAPYAIESFVGRRRAAERRAGRAGPGRVCRKLQVAEGGGLGGVPRYVQQEDAGDYPLCGRGHGRPEWRRIQANRVQDARREEEHGHDLPDAGPGWGSPRDGRDRRGRHEDGGPARHEDERDDARDDAETAGAEHGLQGCLHRGRADWSGKSERSGWLVQREALPQCEV